MEIVFVKSKHLERGESSGVDDEWGGILIASTLDDLKGTKFGEGGEGIL